MSGHRPPARRRVRPSRRQRLDGVAAPEYGFSQAPQRRLGEMTITSSSAGAAGGAGASVRNLRTAHPARRDGASAKTFTPQCESRPFAPRPIAGGLPTSRRRYRFGLRSGLAGSTPERRWMPPGASTRFPGRETAGAAGAVSRLPPRQFPVAAGRPPTAGECAHGAAGRRRPRARGLAGTGTIASDAHSGASQ